MARQWFLRRGAHPFSGALIDEDGEDEYFVRGSGLVNEDQPPPAAAPPLRRPALRQSLIQR